MPSIIQTITDSNGKQFDVDISKICDINGDGNSPEANIQDSAMRNRVAKVHDVKIVDSKGNVLDSEKLINDIKSGKTTVAAIDVDTEATHSGKNHNYCVYYEDSMEKDAESFMNPFHKPMLKNHDSYSEPLGRVIQAYHGPSELTDERSAIHLKIRVTDSDAIPKFIDKRYGTVSIGGSMGTVTCNICGKTILKDGKFHFCGHWRGETYKDQVCYWGARDIEYHEVSVVNNPADDYAQIMKVTVLTDKDIQNDNKEETPMDGNDNTKPTQANVTDNTSTQNVDDITDQILGTTQTSVPSTTPATANVGTETTDSTTQNSVPTEGADNNHTEGTTTDSTADNTDNTSADDKIKNIEKELAAANDKIKTLESDAIDFQSRIDTLTKDLDNAKEDAKTFKDKCVALATANKEAIVDKIIASETFESEDAKSSRKSELMIKSMKELKAMADSINQAQTVRTRPVVQSPVLTSDELIRNKNNTTDGNSTQNADTNINNNNKKTVTVDDATKLIVSKLFR